MRTKESAEEDATGRRKKASITQMLNTNQEEDLADWWKDHLGLYNKSNKTCRRKENKDRLIAEKAWEMGVRGFDGKMLAGRMKQQNMQRHCLTLTFVVMHNK